MDDKGNFMAVLDEVINARYGERLPTLITTNLNADGVQRALRVRIADRIRGTVGSLRSVMCLSGEDGRR